MVSSSTSDNYNLVLSSVLGMGKKQSLRHDFQNLEWINAPKSRTNEGVTGTGASLVKALPIYPRESQNFQRKIKGQPQFLRKLELLVISSPYLVEKCCIYSYNLRVCVISAPKTWRTKNTVFFTHVFCTPIYTAGVFKLLGEIT